MERIERLDPPPLVVAPQHGGLVLGDRVTAWTRRLCETAVGADMAVGTEEKERYIAVVGDLVGSSRVGSARRRRPPSCGAIPPTAVSPICSCRRRPVRGRFQDRAARGSREPRQDARAAFDAADHPELRRLFAEALGRHGLGRPGVGQ